jgi:hypothetical protein
MADAVDDDCTELDEPLDPNEAKRLIRTILKEGIFSFSTHADREMKKDDLNNVDCVNVLRGGVVEQPEHENGTWRYRVRTNRIVVVVAFRSSKELLVVTAWRVQ